MRSIFVLALLACQFLTVAAAFAAEPRPLSEIHKDLIELEAAGIAPEALAGMDQLDPEDLISKSALRKILLYLERYVDEESEMDGSLDLSPLVDALNRLAGIPPEDTSFRSATLQKVFMVLVDLHRRCLRSGDRELVTLSAIKLSQISILDHDLFEDLVAALLSPNSQSSFVEAVTTAQKGMAYYLTDGGEVRLSRGYEKERTKFVSMLILEPLLSEKDISGYLARLESLRGKGFGTSLDLEGWTIIKRFVDLRWGKISRADKEKFIAFMEHFDAGDEASVDLLLALDRQKRIIPLKLAILRAVAHFSPKYPKASEWVRLQLKDPSPSVRHFAATRIGHHGNSSSLALLQKAFDNEQDLEAKAMIFYAITRYWERQERMEQKNAFVNMVNLYSSTTGYLHGRYGRILALWGGQLDKETQLRLGFDRDVALCSEALHKPPGPAQEDIWVGI